MNFFVPTINTKFKLTKPFECIIIDDYRNRHVIDSFGQNINEIKQYKVHFEKESNCVAKKNVIKNGYFFWLPENTIMKIYTVYIKENMKDWDAVGLKILETSNPFILSHFIKPNKKINEKKAKFWVRLCDFNKIEAEILEDNVYHHIVEQ